jgi:hypothetical protein
MVPDEPESIISCIECIDRGGTVTDQQKRMLRLFAVWRSAVWRIEAELDGSIRVLLYAAGLAESHGDAALSEPIRQHAYDNFSIEMPPVPPVSDWERVIHRRGKRWDLLPGWMRTLRRPRQQVV